MCQWTEGEDGESGAVAISGGGAMGQGGVTNSRGAMGRGKQPVPSSHLLQREVGLSC